MRGQAVLGKDLVPHAHAGVAIDLGDDGGGRDGVAARVALDQGTLGQGKVDRNGIDQQEIGRRARRLTASRMATRDAW